MRLVLQVGVMALSTTLLAGLFPPAAASAPQDRVVVGSKAFAESYLLAEAFAQLLESRGFDVERRLGLGSTEVLFQALRTGAVDVYPEYTGTGLLVLLDRSPDGSPEEIFRIVQEEFRERWGVGWLPGLGFENTYAISVHRETAEAFRLETLSDLAREGPHLVGGFSPDFLGREDGLPGLQEAYGLRLRQTRSLLQAIKYEALAARRVDVIDAYSTDGRLAGLDAVILRDDRDFFPPYEAAPVVSPRVLEELPEAVEALSSLAGRLDEEAMRGWNRRVEVEAEPLAQVARDLLREAGVIGTGDPGSTLPGETEEPSLGPASPPVDSGLVTYMWDRREALLSQTVQHLFLVGLSLLAAVTLAVPMGLVLERAAWGAEGVIRAVGGIQTVPSIALLAFMIPLLGVGVLPALVALFLYSLFPILRNTFTGVRDADPAAVDAAEALGMTPGQILTQVRLPLASPVIMAGIRTAAVLNVGTATLAAFIGAGGLGDPIVAGLALADSRMILSGAIPAALLALGVDGALAWVERRLRPLRAAAG